MDVNGQSNSLESYPRVERQPELCVGPTKDSGMPAKESGQPVDNQVAGFPYIREKKKKKLKGRVIQGIKA